MKPKSKLLTWAIPVMILLSAYALYEYGIADLYRRASDTREQYALEMKMVEKYSRMIARKPALEKQYDALKQRRKDEESKMFAAQTVAIASANLQNAVKSLIAERGGVINSERMEKTQEDGKFKILSVSVDAVFPDVRTLAETLAAIESQAPYLVLKEVDVRVRNYTDPKDLMVKLKVAALTGS